MPTLIGSIGLGIAVNDIAIQINRNVPEEITGHLVYALTGNNNLISFDSDAPAIVRSLVPVSGLAAGQVLSGMDFRPATGELYVLGYNSTTGEANLYPFGHGNEALRACRECNGRQAISIIAFEVRNPPWKNGTTSGEIPW